MRRRLVVPLALLVVVSASSCGAANQQQAIVPMVVKHTPTPEPVPPTPVRLPTAVPQPTPPLPAGHPLSATARKQLTQVEDETAKVRNLQPKAGVPANFITQKELHDNMVAQLRAEYTPEQARQDATEYWLLRLVNDRGIDLYGQALDAQTDDILGFYNPGIKQLFVIGNARSLDLDERTTLSHEFVHSLQDQYYDLGKLLPAQTDDSDRSLAVRALVEGDATFSSYDYAYHSMSPDQFASMIRGEGNASSSGSSTREIDKLSEYLGALTIFPYIAGFDFVDKLVETAYDHGEADKYRLIDEAFANPPVSTAQILHPEKYLATPRADPVPVSLPALNDALGAGWTYRDGGTLGEFDLLMMLEVNKANKPDVAADGWQGGQYAFYMNNDSAVIMLGIRCSSLKDADELQQAFSETFQKSGVVDGDVWTDGGRYFGVKRADNVFVLVGATDRKWLDAAMSTVKWAQ